MHMRQGPGLNRRRSPRSVVAGGLFGVTIGVIAYAVESDGRRDFVSEASVSADRYEVQADDEVVAEVRRALESAPDS